VTLLSQLAALAAIAGTGVVYGTDVFCASSSGQRSPGWMTPPSPQ
jgi:hypothetical protein